MFKVVLHAGTGETSEYRAPSLQYAKRYADLYKDDYPYVEIIKSEDGIDTIFETFGNTSKKE